MPNPRLPLAGALMILAGSSVLPAAVALGETSAVPAPDGTRPPAEGLSQPPSVPEASPRHPGASNAPAAELPPPDAAQGQGVPNGTAPLLGDRDSGVIRPPAGVDPGINQGTPAPPSHFPTPVVPPPGSPGGDTTVVPK